MPQSPHPSLDQSFPHGADCGHVWRKALTRPDGGGGGAATSGGLGGGRGVVPPVGSCVAAVTHATAVPSRAARSRHSAEVSALAEPKPDHHRPNARTKPQIRTQGRIVVCTLFIARPLTLVFWPDTVRGDFPRSALAG